MLQILTSDSARVRARVPTKKKKNKKIKDKGTFWVGNGVTNGERFARAMTATIYQNLFGVILRVRWHETLLPRGYV